MQANYGLRSELQVDGVPVEELLGSGKIPLPIKVSGENGSIIIIVATDAPLIASWCKWLARRAMVGLARLRGLGSNSSGDLLLAFSTGNHIPA